MEYFLLLGVLLGVTARAVARDGTQQEYMLTLDENVFPDKPLQLVAPDPKHHKKLIIIEKNVKLLQRIPGPVATVAVVGKFHSGKSFLLNQLMRKEGGFGVGPTVKPETMGIWMWGRPMKMRLPSGEFFVIFLDTEGFAASNISEIYDAKVFSVATLLSSYLLYNSVKIIDQADIDYLELLARRTQLFALRSQLSKSKWTDEFNHDLLNFPPLMWVVQDFVQLTENDESPKEWLTRLMKSSAKDQDEHEISLLGIFRSVDCHTLFLPAVKRVLLQDLSKAKDNDLTEEYKDERDSLIEKIRQGLEPKEKNGRPLRGPELATLLEILVTAANDGSLSTVPSRWESFIERLEGTAKEDCLVFYEAEMQVLHNQYKNGPIGPMRLKDWHEMAKTKAHTLLTHLLFGLGAVVNDSSRGLERDISDRFSDVMEMNDKKIKLKCAETRGKLILEAEEVLKRLQFPMKSTELAEEFNRMKEQSTEHFTTELEYLSAGDSYSSNLEQLEVSLNNLEDSYTLKNRKALEAVLQEAVEKAMDQFRKSSANTGRIPRTKHSLERLVISASEGAVEVFEENSDIAKSENIYEPYLALLRGSIADETRKLDEENEELIRIHCDQKSKEITGLFKDNTGVSRISLPMNKTDLQERLQQEVDRSLSSLKQSQLEYQDSPSFPYCLETLKTRLDQVCEQRHHENLVAYTKEVEIPLRTSKKIIELSAEKYDTEFSARQYMTQVCMLNLNEGKPKFWPQDLKETIIENFIETDRVLKQILQSRSGLWLRVKGFFQWLLWLFNLY